MRLLFFYSLLLLVFAGTFLRAQTALSASAGNDYTLCPGATGLLGGTPTAQGGTPPYTYNWSPATGLSSATAANPSVTVNTTTTFYLEVVDSLKKKSFDTITVSLDPIQLYTAGPDTSVCLGKSVMLGSAENAAATGYNFSWSPTTGLDVPNSGNPISTPPSTIQYTLTVSDALCSYQSQVKVSIRVISLANFRDTTIYEGNTITLHANGASNYTWTPVNNYIKYDHTPTPDVWPPVTTTYTVEAVDGGCFGVDTVRVNVIPSDDLVFYSAFSPNSDGVNDFFYIGNIYKYPDNLLKVYNRYGQVIFTSSGYNNDWDGSYQGNIVPTGTYFYVLDTGTDKGKYHGTVTILR